MILLPATLAFGADLTFDEAIRLALAEGAQARIVTASAAVERGEARETAAYPGNPELSAERKPGETTVQLSVPIDVAAVARGGAARQAIGAADVRERAGRAAVASAAGAAYLDALRATEIARLAGDAQALSSRLGAAGRARFAAGEISPAEHALLLADAAHALDAALTLRRDADNAGRLLGVLLGLPEVPALAQWPALAVPEIDATRIPAVLAADLDARAALQRLHAARLSLLPALSLTGGWDFEGGPVYGASLTLPLFAPGTARVQVARANQEKEDAAARLAGLDAASAVASARAELDIAEQVARAWDIPDLPDALDAAGTRYAAGEASLVTFVNERDLALTALTRSVDARWRLQRARLALWELAGEMPTTEEEHR